MATKKKRTPKKRRDRLAVHYSSDSAEWETPGDLFHQYDVEHHFTLDVCATKKNAKVKNFFSKKDNGLEKDWGTNVCWMNPPYGRGITGLWVKKAFEASLDGATVVCLLPARTDTAFFHTYCKRGQIRFLRGRLKFVGAKHSAPFPSMIVTFKPPQGTGGEE